MQRGRKRRRSNVPLVVCAAFEPNRLAAECLAEAYEHIVPVVRRTTKPVHSLTTLMGRGESLGEGMGS